VDCLYINLLSGINKDKIRKFFQLHVDRSGHTLEVIVTRSLPGYSIESEFPYIDKDESKGRYTLLQQDRYPHWECSVIEQLTDKAFQLK
jgi:hypothetical protein